MKRKTWLIMAPLVTALLVVFDQITKMLARNYLKEEGVSIIKGVFKLELVKNEGAAFGMLQGKFSILSIVGIVLVAVVVYFYIIMPEGKKYNAMRILGIFIVAGALGNMIDRIFEGEVTDFLYFELIDFPVFNVADCYITVGTIILFILMVFYYKDADLEFLSFRKKKNDQMDGPEVENDQTDDPIVEEPAGDDSEKEETPERDVDM